MDRASDYGSEGWGFESLRGRFFLFFKGIVKVIKEMQKKRDIFGLRKLIQRHKIENLHVFLKNL